MSKISNEGLQQIQIIKNAVDSIFDKLESTELYTKAPGKIKNIEEAYKKTNAGLLVQEELSTISEIVAEAQTWDEVSETEEV